MNSSYQGVRVLGCAMLGSMQSALLVAIADLTAAYSSVMTHNNRTWSTVIPVQKDCRL